MSKKGYPCIGEESRASGAKKCSCCELPAVKRIDIQTNWFRGDDDVLLVCDAHLVIARAGLFSALYRAQEVTNKARRAGHGVSARVPCGICGRKVKEVGMQDHLRDAHGQQPLSSTRVHDYRGAESAAPLSKDAT